MTSRIAVFCMCAIQAAELRLCIRTDPKTLEPLAVTDQASDTVRRLTTASLLRRNRVSQILEPEIAERWEVRDKGASVVLRLRAGVRYSDGTPLDSQDVRRTLERLLDPEKAYPSGEGLRAAGIVSIETPSPLEVRIRTRTSVAGVESLLEEVPILSSRSPLGDKAALGPFVLRSYRRGHSLQFERNANYFKKDSSGRPLPRLDTIRVDIQPNPELERNQFERDEIHLLQTLDVETYAALDKAGLAKDAGPTLESEVLWFNQAGSSPLPDYKKRWFQSREFRCGVSAALRRDDFVRIIYGGRAVPGVGPIAPVSKQWFSPAMRAQAYDSREALAHLQNAGFRLRDGVLRDGAGNAVTFSLITNSGNRLRTRMAVMIQQDLEKIGIKINVVPLDMPSLLERMTRSSNYEAILLGMVGIDLDPNGQMNVWLSSSASHPWNPSQKTPATAWEAEIDRLMLAQFHSTSIEKRKQHLREFQSIVAAESPVLFLVHPHALVAVSRRLTGVRLTALHPRVLWNIEELGLIPDSRASRK